MTPATIPALQVGEVEVLLIDDSRADALFVAEALACLGHVRLHVVRTGDQALAFLHRNGRYAAAPRPGLIFLDINMPRMSGHEVLTRIRAEPQFADIAVVMLTSSAADQDRNRASALGANEFVTKPANFDEFAATVRVIVERSTLRGSTGIGGYDE